MSSDVSWLLGTNCDQCLSMVQCCFTSTETARLVRTKYPGRPPRLSHSSWTLSWALTTMYLNDYCIKWRQTGVTTLWSLPCDETVVWKFQQWGLHLACGFKVCLHKNQGSKQNAINCAARLSGLSSTKTEQGTKQKQQQNGQSNVLVWFLEHGNLYQIVLLGTAISVINQNTKQKSMTCRLGKLMVNQNNYKTNKKTAKSVDLSPYII